jgi:hypothetical protein
MATNGREDRLSAIPKPLQAIEQGFSKIFYRLKKTIGEAFRVLEDVPQLLARIAVGTVWRKRHNMHALRQAPVTLPPVESGLFGNHNTIGLRIA